MAHAERATVVFMQYPFKTMLLCLILSALVLACTSNPPVDRPRIANPASVYCEEHGGKLTIVIGDEGQSGICTLVNGSVCEEWAFMRGECPKACGPCPQFSPSSPDYCKNGTLVPSSPDACGCAGPPACVS